MSLSDSEPSVSYSVIGIWSVSIFLTSESVDPGLSDSINWFISKNGLFCGKQRENTNVIRTSVLTYRLRGGRIPQTRSALSAYFCVLGFFVLIFVSFIIAKVWFIRDIDFVGADYCLRGERVGFDFKRFRFFFRMSRERIGFGPVDIILWFWSSKIGKITWFLIYCNTRKYIELYVCWREKKKEKEKGGFW